MKCKRIKRERERLREIARQAGEIKTGKIYKRDRRRNRRRERLARERR
jgi:hypothetical protein